MSFSDAQPQRRGPMLEWLGRVNGQVAGWAAQASWGRLVVLFFVVLIAGTILGHLLHLEHDKVKVAVPARKGESHTVVVDGKTIRIGPDGIRTVKPRSGASAADSSSPNPDPNPNSKDDDDDDEDVRWVSQRVVTFRGIVGDIAAAALVL